MPETEHTAESVAADLSLLWQAARVSPHLREAVERVEEALNVQSYYSGGMYDLFREFGIDPRGRPALSVLRDILAAQTDGSGSEDA